MSSVSLIGRRISPACSFPYVHPEMSRADGADRPDARGPGPATKDCPGSCSALSTEIYFNIHTRRSVCARRSRPEGSAGFFGQPALEPSPPRRSFAARRSSEALPIHLPRSAMRLGTQTATGSFAMTSSTAALPAGPGAGSHSVAQRAKSAIRGKLVRRAKAPCRSAVAAPQLALR